MGKFNEELVKAGVMLAGRRAAPELEGRPRPFAGRQDDGHRRTVRRDEGAHRRLLDVEGEVEGRGASNGCKRSPFDGGAEVEIRQVFEADDFGAELTPELRDQEDTPPCPDR